MIVMKFGGTSVQDAEAIASVVRIVKDKLPKHPVVVVSAAAGVTNALLETGRLALNGDKDGAIALLEQLRKRHIAIATGLLENPSALSETSEYINSVFARLKSLTEGIVLVGELSKRSQDMLTAHGELLNSRIVVAAFRSAEIRSEWFDARNIMITDQQFGSAVPDAKELRRRSLRSLRPLIEKGTLVVTQGFIGATADGITTTLGRGGSDYTAALLGAAMNASAIEIWTDVDGVLTTDPRMVKNAKRVKQMTFREASELAYFGARVLHPATIIPAIDRNIPVYVYNTKNPASSGTLIAERLPKASGRACVIKSIAYKKDITILNIASTRMLLAHGFLASIFDVFKKHQTSVDVVSTTEVSVSLTIDHTDKIKAILHDLKDFAEVTVESERAIICMVGEQMRTTPGILARAFSALKKININMVSQGASEINLTFVIDQKDTEFAVKALHREFFSGRLSPLVFE